MAGQSITFDFLTRGADSTASGFRKVGDNTVLAARGAKVLADAIGKLGDKENRTAAESALLAKALRQTGDAEDRVAARAVVADAAIRRLDDAMQDTNKHSGELGKTLSGLKLNPGLVGPLLALAPAIATLGGVGAGAAAGLGGAFIAGGAALAAFGAVAKPILSDAKKAATAVATAEDAHAAAVAKVTGQYQYAMSVAKTKAQKDAAYATEQKSFSAAGLAQTAAQSKAYAGLSGAQIALSKQLGDMAAAWDKVKAAETPVVAGALQPWLKSVTGLTSALGPIIAKIAPVIASLGAQFNSLVTSSAFKGFRDFIGATGAAAVSAGGSTIIDLIKSFMILLPKFDPLIREAIGWISRLGPAVLSWASSKKASDQIQAFLQWFSQNGPTVGAFLKSIGAALKALAPGLTAGGTAELQAMTTFLNFVAKLPPGLAKPLAEVAGAMLILQKTGVVSVGIKLTGLAAGASGAGAAAGPFAAAGAAIGAGILLGIRHAISAGWKTAVSELPKLLEGVGSILNFSATGWSQAILDHFAKPVRQMWDNLGHFTAASADITRHQVARAWDMAMQAVIGAGRAAWNTIAGGFRWLVGKILDVFSGIVHGAAIAFGWVPGIGAKLRGAAAAFDVFRDNVNKALGGINGRTVSVSVAMTSSTNPYKGGISGRAASGMYVSQGTGPTADDVLIRASRGELVVPTRLVRAGAVDHLRGSIPGFAGGGPVGVNVAASAPGYATITSRLMASVDKLAQTFGSAAFAAANVPNVGSGVARWAPLVRQALAMEGLSPGLLAHVLYQIQTESGGNPNAINLSDINAQRGDPSRGLLQTIGSTFRAYHWPGTSSNIYDPLANIAAALNYARHTYGPSLMSHGMGIGSGSGYALGGLVPGYASGGTVARQGAAYLHAWRSRHGGGFGAAHGPVAVNEQIARMSAAAGRAQSLAGASGLSPGQHRFWAGAAADEKKRLGVLHKEVATERSWRTMLELNELALAREVASARGLPGLAGPARGWKAKIGRDKATVTGISKMLGYSSAYLAAHKPAPKVTPPGVPGSIPHPGVYTDSTADLIRQLFTSLASNSRVVTLDSGGWLMPGVNAVANKTGRPEQVLPPGRSGGGGAGTVVLQNHGVIGSQAQLEDWLVRSLDSLKRKRRV